MASTVWFEEDVTNAIRAAAFAAYSFSNANPQSNSEFLRGYLSALNTMSAAFGIQLPELASQTESENKSITVKLGSGQQFMLPD